MCVLFVCCLSCVCYVCVECVICVCVCGVWCVCVLYVACVCCVCCVFCVCVVCVLCVYIMCVAGRGDRFRSFSERLSQHTLLLFTPALAAFGEDVQTKDLQMLTSCSEGQPLMSKIQPRGWSFGKTVHCLLFAPSLAGLGWDFHT